MRQERGGELGKKEGRWGGWRAFLHDRTYSKMQQQILEIQTGWGTKGIPNMKDPPSKIRMGPQRAVAPPNPVVAPLKQ